MLRICFIAMQVAAAISATTSFAAVTRAKVAELAGHRIGRLVDTNVIEDNYISRLHKIEVTELTTKGPTDPVFKVVVSQVPPSAGEAHRVELLMNDAGRTLSDVETRGQDSSNPVDWQGTDPLTITETVLHFITDSREAKIQPYKSGAAAVTVEQNQVNGTIIGQVKISLIDSASVLEVDVGLNSEVLRFRILTP